MHVVVLGAGLAGLSCAYELVKAGHQVTLLEKENYAGGMATSWKVGPYWLDHGPHRFHSKDEDLLEHIYEVLDNDYVFADRQSRIFMQGKFFDYPLKTGNVLRNLPPHIMARAIFDYLWIRIVDKFKPLDDSNFEGWTKKRFGKTLYEIFFGTYTSKAWKMPCNQISSDWASQRISQANLWDAIVKTIRPPKGGEVRSLVSKFWYPTHGGIGQLGRKYAEKLVQRGAALHLSTPVKRIEIEDGLAKRVVYEKNGVEHVLHCDHVVNTIPLPRALEAFAPAIDAETRQAIANLKYIGIVFIYMELDQPSVSPDHWVYLPEQHLTVHRISEFKNFSKTVAPENKTVVCCEITCRWDDEHWNLDLQRGFEIAERDLVTVGLIKQGVARPLDIAKVRYAYPVYDLSYKANLEVLKKAAKKVRNLQTTGRQGLYRYNNMDHSIAMGRKIAKTLSEGRDANADSVAAGKEYFG